MIRLLLFVTVLLQVDPSARAEQSIGLVPAPQQVASSEESLRLGTKVKFELKEPDEDWKRHLETVASYFDKALKQANSSDAPSGSTTPIYVQSDKRLNDEQYRLPSGGHDWSQGTFYFLAFRFG